MQYKTFLHRLLHLLLCTLHVFFWNDQTVHSWPKEAAQHLSLGALRTALDKV